MQVFLWLSQSASWHFSSQYLEILQPPQKYNHTLSLPQLAHLGVLLETKFEFTEIFMTWYLLQGLRSSTIVLFFVSTLISSSSLLLLSLSWRITALNFSSMSRLTSWMHFLVFRSMSVIHSSISLFTSFSSRSKSLHSALYAFRSFFLSSPINISACSATTSSNEGWSFAMFSFSRFNTPLISCASCSAIFSWISIIVSASFK